MQYDTSQALTFACPRLFRNHNGRRLRKSPANIFARICLYRWRIHLFPAMQTGHQCPARTWYATAHQMCPSAQRHFTCWSVLERLSERHSPPIRQAVSCKPRTVIAIVPAHDRHHRIRFPDAVRHGNTRLPIRARHCTPSHALTLALGIAQTNMSPPRGTFQLLQLARACRFCPLHISGTTCPCWMSLGWASHS